MELSNIEDSYFYYLIPKCFPFPSCLSVFQLIPLLIPSFLSNLVYYHQLQQALYNYVYNTDSKS